MPVSDRVALARLAAQAAQDDPAVVLSAGPLRRWVTADGDDVIEGVVAVLVDGGRVDVTLHADLLWPPPPLAELADRLRAGTRAAADTAGLGASVGNIDVDFHDVRDVREAA